MRSERKPTAPGERVELVGTTDPYTRLQRGARGTVRAVDGFGTVHVAWDDGSTLGLVPGEDRWTRVGRETANGEQRYARSER